MLHHVRWCATAALVAFAAAAETGLLGPLAHDGLRHAALIAAGMGLAALWGVAAAVPVAVLVGALVSGVPLSRHGLGLLVEHTPTALATVAGVVLPLFTGTVTTLRTQIGVHKAAAGRAQFDPLTGLLNRVALEGHLHEWIADARAKGQHGMFAVLFLDLDRFKVVNDTYGHEVGDRLLCAVAQLLRDNVRAGDLVARLGGDEFVIAMPGLRDRWTAGAVAGKLVELLSSPIDVGNGRLIGVSASIGIATHPADGDDVATLLGSADNAMYAVKSGGKNSFVYSNVRLRDQHARRVEIESRLRRAVADHALEVAYQPQFELAGRRLVGFEALLRWEDDALGKVSPGEFVPIAEEAGLIVPIGHWLLREACFQLRSWDAAGGARLGVAVNVSTLQFRQADFVEQVEAALRDSQLAPERLEIEVTESVLIEQFDVAVQALRRLHRIGVRTALDDFGTGYSSLAYLHRLPIHALKIDRSFVSALALSSTGRTSAGVPLVDAITAMGRTLGKTVVAEGVETPEQAVYLKRIGVHRAQGFFLGRPLGPAQALRLIERQRAEDERAALESERRSQRADDTGSGRVQLLLD